MTTAMNRHASKSPGGINPLYKIRCNKSTILIGDQEFLSASDALELYISQYEDTGLLSKPKTYRRSANDLLNPKSALHMTAERSLETGIRATDKELELADAKDSMNESLLKMKKSVALRAEAKKNYLRRQRERVEDALNKSQELLNDLDKDEYPDRTECPSEVGSLSTDVLLSMNPVEAYQDAGGSKLPAWKSKHVFGYKRPRSRRSKTLGSIQISHDMMALINEQPSQTFSPQKSKTANTSKGVTFEDERSVSPLKNDIVGFDDDVSFLLSESPKSRLPRTPDKKLRERSRSVSPSILKRERKMFESGLRDKPIPDIYTDFDITPHKPPSWIDTMNLSDVSDTDWKKRDYTTSRPPPSWVDGMDKSDITSVVSAKPVKKLELQDLLRPLPVITNTQDSSMNSEADVNDTSLPAPGLSYRDLVGDTSKLSLSNTQTKAQPLQPSLSTKLDDLKQKTTAALERYHERLQSNEDSPFKGGNLYSGEKPPRCSSLDTEALIAGVASPGSSDIMGASPIKRIGDNDSLVTELSSPGKPRQPPSANTDLVLEGDRPWEKTPSFKPAVSVHNASKSFGDTEGPNFSGGSQPGSLEALKNMIFKLQQEASLTDSEDEGSRKKLSERVRKLREEAAGLGISVPGDKEGGDTGTDKAPGDIPSLKGYNFKAEPGGQSLEKALVHLDRLKNLVHTTQQQQQSPEKQTANGVTPLCANMEDA